MNSKFLGFLLLMSFACHKSEHKEAANSFDDEQLIKIYEYQDQRNSKALIPFLKAKETEHRLAAALAFASIQDSFAIEYLGQMAQSDLKEEARRAAVYALGQIGNRRCCPVLQSALRFETSKTNIRFILESLGKCADSATWNFNRSAPTPLPQLLNNRSKSRPVH
jgi:HEAT repeat protein